LLIDYLNREVQIVTYGIRARVLDALLLTLLAGLVFAFLDLLFRTTALHFAEEPQRLTVALLPLSRLDLLLPEAQGVVEQADELVGDVEVHAACLIVGLLDEEDLAG